LKQPEQSIIEKPSRPVFAADSQEVDIGARVRELRTAAGLSIRALAEASGLNVNTLSFIENNKSSPSVSTLQQLAATLNIPLTAFFEAKGSEKQLVFQKAVSRPRVEFSYGVIEDLGVGLTLRGGQPLIISLEPHADSGATPIVHTGHEFVYCLEGRLTYIVEGQEYALEAEDSLIFEAHLPHSWKNQADKPARFLLILCPTDEKDRPTERHFSAR
jgi:transcriptional regulator with XRE-family HTH domain